MTATNNLRKGTNMQKLTNPPKEFAMTAIIDNGSDWQSTGIEIGDGHETGPRYVDRATAHMDPKDDR